MKTAGLTASLLVLLLAPGISCTVEEEAPLPGDVTPEVAPRGPELAFVPDGLEVDGQSLLLGAPAPTIQQLLGPRAQVRELADLGTVYSFPELGLEVWTDATAATVRSIQLFEGYAGTAPGAVVPGDTEALALEVLGQGVDDPFGQGWHYPDAGLFVGVAAGLVNTVSRSVAE